jgi:hypothetical protein
LSLFAGQSRDALRDAWRVAWQRHGERLPLEPLQAQMADLIGMHPEYHALLAERAAAPAPSDPATDSPDHANAFLHLGLHLALREQLATDRPRGIAAVHRRLRAAGGDGHEAEHRMIEVLAQILWEAQRARRMPDEQAYLEALRRL